MDTNDRIKMLIQDIPEGASVLLALKPDGTYALVWDGTRGWKIVMLSQGDGEMLSLVYPADVNRRECVPVAVVHAELRKRYLDAVLAELA